MIKDRIPGECDVLVVGSGAAALVSAMRIKHLMPDRSVWVVEKTESLGGCTAYSGGGVWVPGNSFLKKRLEDSESAKTYIQNAYPEVDKACLNAFLDDAPHMLEFILSKGVQMEGSLGYPDYYQELKGASAGRTVFPNVYKGPGKIRSLIRKTPAYFLPYTFNEFQEWGLHRIGHWDKTLLAKRKLLGHFTMGKAFIGFMIEACLEAGVHIALRQKLDHLIIQNAQIVGAEVNGKRISTNLVIMACGGFSHNSQLLGYLAAVRPVLSVAPEESDDGGGLSVALDANLEVGNPYGWWAPIMKLYAEGEEKPGPDLWAYHSTLQDRCWPGGIMVNAKGRRFTNESACYNTVGGILALDKDPLLDRVWLIWGDYYVKNYIRGTTSYLHPAKNYMNKSKTLEQLAGKIDVPASNLKETLERWNEMAVKGRDEDYHRGESPYDRYMGDNFRDGHPNIGPVDPPFQAVRLYPGCLGTKMGPVTDEDGRVRLKDGRVVSGLYAAGNAAASFFGNTYPGAGATLGQACVFAFRAADHAAGRPVSGNS